MFALRHALRAFALMCAAAAAATAAMAQPYSRPQKVHVPIGKVQVARIANVTSVFKFYTAAGLEMKTGDLVFALDGMPVDSAERFNEMFNKKTDDGAVRIDFVRDGVVHQSVGPLFRFTRGVFKSDKPLWGGGLETTAAEFAPSLLEKPVVRNIMALELSFVKANAAAGVAGLQKKDLLLSINGRPLDRAKRSDILVPLFPEGTLLKFVYLRDGKLLDGEAPLTAVRMGFAKSLMFGFGGESRMVELHSEDLPVELAKDVKIILPGE